MFTCAKYSGDRPRLYVVVRYAHWTVKESQNRKPDPNRPIVILLQVHCGLEANFDLAQLRGIQLANSLGELGAI